MATPPRLDPVEVLLTQPVRQRRLPLLNTGPHEEPTWQQLTAKLDELQQLVITRGRRVLLSPALELHQLCKAVADLCLAEERCLELLVATAHQLSPCHLDCLLRGLELAGASHLADYLRLNQCITPREAPPICQGVIPGCPHLLSSAAPCQAGTPRPAGAMSDAVALSQQLDTLRALRSARNHASVRPRAGVTSGNRTPKAGGTLLAPVQAPRPPTPATPIAFREQRYLFLAACSDVVGKCGRLEVALQTMDPFQTAVGAEPFQSISEVHKLPVVEPLQSTFEKRRVPVAEPLQALFEEELDQPESVSLEPQQAPGVDAEQQVMHMMPNTMPEQGAVLRMAADPLGRDPLMDFLENAALQCMQEPTALFSPDHNDSCLALLRSAIPNANLDVRDVSVRLNGKQDLPCVTAPPETNLDDGEMTNPAAPKDAAPCEDGLTLTGADPRPMSMRLRQQRQASRKESSVSDSQAGLDPNRRGKPWRSLSSSHQLQSSITSSALWLGGLTT